MRRPIALISSAGVRGYDTVPRNAWRRSRSLIAHSGVPGSPPVVGAAKPREAPQHEKDDWSRARMRVYASRNEPVCAITPVKEAVSCLVSDWRSERMSSTSPNAGKRRELVPLSAPAAGSMESTVSVHCDGIAEGSWAYRDQSGLGTAAPMQSSSVSALARPGAPSAALYSVVGVRLRKSPIPPRRKVDGRPAGPPPNAQLKPMRGDRCTSLGIRSVCTANSESAARLYGGAPLKREASSRAA